MRFLHTSDWHLGKQLYQRSLLDDQRDALEQVRAMVADQRPDALVIAGDLYDRAVPPGDAVTLLGDFIAEVAIDLDTPIVMIAGNHDSAARVGFGAKLFERYRVCIGGLLDAERGIPRLILEDAHGPVCFHAIPYADPATVHAVFPYEGARTHHAATEALANAAAAATPEGARSVCVAHAFVTGGASSDSERLLTVGGSGQVDAEIFAPFTYTALGHLHGPQSAGPRVRYSGSLLPYSFSEVTHEKGVDLVEIDGEGCVSIERLPIMPRTPMCCLEGELAELLASPDASAREAYVQVTLTDRAPVFEAMGRLREHYPHLLELVRRGYDLAPADAPPTPRAKVSPVEEFEAFYAHVTGEGMGDAHRAFLIETLEALGREEREA